MDFIALETYFATYFRSQKRELSKHFVGKINNWEFIAADLHKFLKFYSPWLKARTVQSISSFVIL